MRPSDIAGELGKSKATISYHLQQLAADGPTTNVGRRAIVATLGASGVRVSEFCDLGIRDLRLHAATGAHFRIPDAKTEAGIREVQPAPTSSTISSPRLDLLQRAGHPTDATAYLFPDLRGGRMSRQRAAAIV